MDDFSWPIFLIGLLISCIWWTGAALAWWRRRGMLTAGLIGAGVVGVVFSATSAGADLPQLLVEIASILRGPVAGLLVASFIAHQPKNAPRPARWTY